VVERKRFESIYASHYDDVLRYCLRRAGRDDALDAAAETFTVAWRRRDDMPAERALPWLYGVARRVLANQWRSAERRSNLLTRLRVVDAAPPSEPERQVVRDQESTEVVAAIHRLRPMDQEVIRLAGWEELGREDIGVALACSPNAVTKRLNGALDRLARELGAGERSRGGRFFTRKGAAG
jgi:RNA polymerase sigma-70 factor (ECF subfamily)